MVKTILSAFSAHPRESGESYFQHLLFTFAFAGRLAYCVGSLIVHGLLPFLCVHTTSAQMKKCQDILSARTTKK